MNEITSEEFFHWMNENGLSRSEIAPKLGLENERSLSTYRSRGLPKSKLPLAAKIMREWDTPKPNEENKINLSFTDEEINSIEVAATIVSTPLREYMRRAIIARARQDMQNSEKSYYQTLEERDKELRPEGTKSYYPGVEEAIERKKAKKKVDYRTLDAPTAPRLNDNVIDPAQEAENERNDNGGEANTHPA